MSAEEIKAIKRLARSFRRYSLSIKCTHLHILFSEKELNELGYKEVSFPVYDKRVEGISMYVDEIDINKLKSWPRPKTGICSLHFRDYILDFTVNPNRYLLNEEILKNPKLAETVRRAMKEAEFEEVLSEDRLIRGKKLKP